MTDERINRKLAAILAADVVGYSRLMEADEAGTLAALKRHRELIFDPAVAAHNGRIVKLIGDGAVVEFGSVVDAVNCALSVQRSGASIGIKVRFNQPSCSELASILAMSLLKATTSTAMASTSPPAWSRSPSPAGCASPRSSTRVSAIGSTFVHGWRRHTRQEYRPPDPSLEVASRQDGHRRPAVQCRQSGA